MDSLFFYKLLSTYPKDITKNCKLLPNEIDHNFATLEDNLISSVTFSNETHNLVLTRMNGEALTVNLDRIVQKPCCCDEAEIVAVELPMKLEAKTGFHKPVNEFINLVDKNEGMPYPSTLKVGYRVLSKEYYNENGNLYNFKSAMAINDSLKNGWHIPSLEEWNAMLNEMELCERHKTHDTLAEGYFGKYAGKFAKNDKWEKADCIEVDNAVLDNGTNEELSEKVINPNGIDKYGLNIGPTGFKRTNCVDLIDEKIDGLYFTTTVNDLLNAPYLKKFKNDKTQVGTLIGSSKNYYAIRLVKEYNSNEYSEYQTIDGLTYRTVVLKGLDGKYYVWLASNFRSQRYDYYKLKNESNVVYYINEWNGEEWLKWRLGEHEEIVVLKNKQQMASKKFVLIKDELVQIKDEYAPEPQTLYKDLGTYGENDDLDLIVLKDIRQLIISNINLNKFDIPNYYSISKKISNSDLREIYAERVNYLIYVKKSISENNSDGWSDCKITLTKSCAEGLEKSQEIDLGENNWDSNGNYIGEITWTEFGEGGGGGTVITPIETVTINFTNFDEELIYFPSDVILNGFQLIGMNYVDMKIGSTVTRVTSSSSNSISINSGTLVQFNIDESSLDGNVKAFVFNKEIIE
jgi:uncharacterized protein (TIGR02145 family)